MSFRFPSFHQTSPANCGPSCLKIISLFYGKNISISKLQELADTTREGSSLLGLSNAAEAIGLRSLGARVNFQQLRKEKPFPCIFHWNQEHFVVLYKITKTKVFISDPSFGLISYSYDDFIKGWIGNHSGDSSNGIVLLVEPTRSFSENKSDSEKKTSLFQHLYPYIRSHSKLLFQLFYGLLAISVIQLIFPLLTQSIIDIGIKNRNIHFIVLIVLTQLFLFFGKTSLEVIRGWILLHLSTRINIAMISEFFIKLMKLPIRYFDTKMTGDLMQRINDHTRIESLLTSSSLNIVFSFVNIILFSIILLLYHSLIFILFISGTSIYIIWVLLFMKKRKELDHKRFSEFSSEQSKVIELIDGMQEIKLHNAERIKRWEWERIQAKLFKISIKTLTVEQLQNEGSLFLNELKNISITTLSAYFVITGEISLGMMLSISYIIGSLNSTLYQVISLSRTIQDAKISLERLNEIYSIKDESNEEKYFSKANIKCDNILLRFDNVTFRYKGRNTNVLDSVSFSIPKNKTTAIVGTSGSGKSTVMKLILGFYHPQKGRILIGNNDLGEVDIIKWREYCGVVMQEGFIFNTSIAKNIAVGEELIDEVRLNDALSVANLHSLMKSLPRGVKTIIGNEGTGLSTGQKQRILIARSVYKNPMLLLFDEATSSLDSYNEKKITNNLQSFLSERTAVIIAHRLSTVQNADQIIVIHKGGVAEIGNHNSLIKMKGFYYNLVRNQLQLNATGLS